MTPGQRIHLNEAGTKWAVACGRRIAGAEELWRNRGGRVFRVFKYKPLVSVVWDGTVSPSEGIPLKFLESE
jgi:hypothetical protein